MLECYVYAATHLENKLASSPVREVERDLPLQPLLHRPLCLCHSVGLSLPCAATGCNRGGHRDTYIRGLGGATQFKCSNHASSRCPAALPHAPCPKPHAPCPIPHLYFERTVLRSTAANSSLSSTDRSDASAIEHMVFTARGCT